METSTKPELRFIARRLALAGLGLAFIGTGRAEQPSGEVSFSEVAARATAEYHGDALTVMMTPRAGGCGAASRS